MTRHQLVRADRLEQLKTDLRASEKQLRSATERRNAVERDLSAELQSAYATIRELEGTIHGLEEKLKPKPKPKPKLPPDYAPATKAIWETVQKRTMTSHGKVNFMVEAMYYLERVGIPGAIVECGVWRGGSMIAGAMALLEMGATHRELFMFDTYEGMSDPTERDVHIWHGQTGDEMLAAQKLGAPIWVPASVEDVKAGFAPLGYPEERLHFVVGKVEDTVPEHAPEQIAMLRLDTDWYESTKHEIDHLYSRLQPGGVLLIDDYGSWQGSKDAVDEFIAANGEPLMLTQVGRGRVAVKPGLPTRVPPAG